MSVTTDPPAASGPASSPVPQHAAFSLSVLIALGFCHLLNDMQQSLLSAIYPMLKDNYGLNFAQIGVITLTYQLTASLLQPCVGIYTDRHPKPYSLAVGMGSTLFGLQVLSRATGYPMILAGAALVGAGSSVFHPESARIAHFASGQRPGLAQAIFQLGGNAGQAIGPLLAAFIVMPGGQRSLGWFSVAALTAIVVLTQIGRWFRSHGGTRRAPRRIVARAAAPVHARGVVARGVVVLGLLMSTKTLYSASLGTFFIFYLIHRFWVSVEASQVYLFIYLGAAALGVLVGGSLGDRFGRRNVIWISILGPLPFALMLPQAGLAWTVVLAMVVGFIMSSANATILVFAQELVPNRVGMVSGIFYGFTFGLGGLGAGALGSLADVTSIEFVYQLCAWLPLLGLFTWFLPDIERERLRQRHAARPD